MENKPGLLSNLRQDSTGEHAIVRKLVSHGDPEALRTGLLSLGWPAEVAHEQASSMRLGLEPAGIERQIMDLSKKYPTQSPGPYETILGNTYGKQPSPRQVYRQSKSR